MNNRNIKGFDLSLVQFSDPQFLAGQKAVFSFIKKLDPERVLCAFRRNAGLPDGGACPYPGWENAKIGGHALGSYFSAAAMAVKAFGDAEMKERLDYIVRELRACQKATGSGFLSAASPAKPDHPDIQFDIEEGKAEGKTWVPWYALHKVLRGLTDIYIYTGNKEALEAATSLGDWVVRRCGSWDSALRKRILATEYGGMNDALYLLYGITGNETYRTAAEAFDDPDLYEHLVSDHGALAYVHANTTIPKFIGALRRAELLPDEQDAELYFRYARDFFKLVETTQMYVTGGIGDMEHFRPDFMLDHARTQCNAESCCVYNMMKLARMLFEMTGDGCFMDYIERSLYNARLGSYHPLGGTTYFNPMGTGFFKVFGKPDPADNVFWCCTGTGMEDFVKMAGYIYYHDEEKLYINQYISSDLVWPERGLSLKLRADIVSGEPFHVSLKSDKEQKVRLCFRIPSWTDLHEFSVRLPEGSCNNINGQYVELAVDLEAGESIGIEIDCPAHLKAEGLPDAGNVLAFTYGPLVLAAELPVFDEKAVAEAGIEVIAPAWKLIGNGGVKLDIEYGKTIRGILKEEYLDLPKGADFPDLKHHPDRFMKRDMNSIELAFDLSGYRFIPYNEIVEQRYGIYWYFRSGKIKTIRSGGQSGVDRAALDVARRHRIEICGWCPKGGLAEDFPAAPGLLEYYPELKETPSSKTAQRTLWNMRDADAILTIMPDDSGESKGTVLGVKEGEHLGKPMFTARGTEDIPAILAWLDSLPDNLDLSIGGPRASECDEAYKLTEQILEGVLERL